MIIFTGAASSAEAQSSLVSLVLISPAFQNLYLIAASSAPVVSSRLAHPAV